MKEKMSSALEQINRLNIQIAESEQEIESVKTSLEKANSSLEEKKLELAKAQEEYDKNKSVIEKRLVAMYETSKTTYLDILVGSNDLTDFLSKYYLVQEIAEYDGEFLNTLQVSKAKLENETKKLEESAKDVETVKNRLTSKQGAMQVLVDDKTNLISTLSEEELELEAQLDQFEEDKKTIQKELEDLAKKNAITASVTPSSCGYISPLLGKTSKNITTGYKGYSGHTGVDFAVASRN